MLIDFMLFAAAHVLGADLRPLRLPEVNLVGQLQENEVVPFGRVVSCLRRFESEVTSKADFFTEFVIDNLLHINEIRIKKLSSQIYCMFMIQSVTVVQAFSKAFSLDLEVFSILLESYFIPVLDDCINAIESCGTSEVEIYCKTGQYFLCRFIGLAIIIGEQEAIKKALRFVIKYLREQKSPNPTVSCSQPRKHSCW